MGTKCKIIAQMEMKGSADLFHDLLKLKPHHLSNVCPQKVQAFTLLEGELGATGSIISWHYIHDGKPCFAKQRIEVLEEKKSIVFNFLEGDLLEGNKSMTLTYHVDTIDGGSLVTWTLDYEKVDVDTLHPGTFINYLLHMNEEIDDHHLNKQIDDNPSIKV